MTLLFLAFAYLIQVMELLKSHQCLCFKSFLKLWKNIFSVCTPAAGFWKIKSNFYTIKKIALFSSKSMSLLLCKQCIHLKGSSERKKKSGILFIYMLYFVLRWAFISLFPTWLSFYFFFNFFFSWLCIFKSVCLFLQSPSPGLIHSTSQSFKKYKK